MRDLKAAIEEFIAENDIAGAQETAIKAVASKNPDIATFYRDVLIPILIDTGSSWQNGRTEIWREHLTSGIVRGVIESLAPEVARQAAAPNGKTVVLACPSEEQHDIGLRMVADLYRLGGWSAYFLGADVPEDQIADAARRLKADTVVLSAATHFHRLKLRELVDSLKRDLPGVAVLVTGAAFRADTDGWSRDELLDPTALSGEIHGRA